MLFMEGAISKNPWGGAGFALFMLAVGLMMKLKANPIIS